MRNITEYGEFKKSRVTTEQVIVNEGAAQIFDDVWKVRNRIEIPISLINSYVKKVQSETGEDPRKKWSEQEIAEELANFVSSKFMTIENLPSSIISSAQKQPTVQTQEDMPVQSQVQPQGEMPIQPQAQPQGEMPVQVPAQEPAQNVAQEVPQNIPGQSQPVASQI